MPFTPWLTHDVVEGWCLGCSRKIPHEAIVHDRGRCIAYSHGELFCPNPPGNTVPCSDRQP